MTMFLEDGLNERLCEVLSGDVAATPEDRFNGLDILLLGTLKVPSGRLVACDPCHIDNTIFALPFELTVPRGEYPLWAYSPHDRGPDENGDLASGTNALIRLDLQSTTPCTWELAHRKLETVVDVHPDGFNEFAFGVDSGTACLMDAEALEVLRASGDSWDALRNAIQDRMHDADGAASVVSAFMFDLGSDSTSANVAVFRTGFGDGIYGSYWGYNGDGEIVSLAIDFQVIGQRG